MKKKGILIAVAGTDQEFETIQTTVEGFFLWVNAEMVDAIFYAHENDELGGVKNDKEKMDHAFAVGVSIAQ